MRVRQNTIQGKKGTVKVTDRRKGELEIDLAGLIAMKMEDKSHLPPELKDHLYEGGLYFLKEQFLDFLKRADNCTHKFSVERTFRRSPLTFLELVFRNVYGNSEFAALI